MPNFPSLTWFETARERANADAAFRALGSADARFGVRVDNQTFAITLDAFEVARVGVATEEEAADLDFCLEMPAADWQSYLGSFASPSRRYLNDLDLTTAGGLLRGNARNRLLFARYNATVERFFELGAAP